MTNFVKTWKTFLKENKFRHSMFDTIREEVEALIEGRKDDVMKKYGDSLGLELINSLSKEDPSGNNKYLMWMAKMIYQSPNHGPGNPGGPEKIVALTKDFHKKQQRLQKRDINAYKTPEELSGELEKLGKSRKEKSSKMKEGAKKVYEDDKFLIVRPETQEASCYYGKNTKWCISATVGTNYFSEYVDRGYTFYFVINKQVPSSYDEYKIAWVVDIEGNIKEFYDATDLELDWGQVSYAYGDDFVGLQEIIEKYHEENSSYNIHFEKFHRAVFETLQEKYGMYKYKTYYPYRSLGNEGIQVKLPVTIGKTTTEIISNSTYWPKHHRNNCHPIYHLAIVYKTEMSDKETTWAMLSKFVNEEVDRGREEGLNNDEIADMLETNIDKLKDILDRNFHHSTEFEKIRNLLNRRYLCTITTKDFYQFNVIDGQKTNFSCFFEMVHQSERFECGVDEEGELDHKVVEEFAFSIAKLKEITKDEELCNLIFNAVNSFVNNTAIPELRKHDYSVEDANREISTQNLLNLL